MKALRLCNTFKHARRLKGAFGARQSPYANQGLAVYYVHAPAFHTSPVALRSHPRVRSCDLANVRRVSIGATSSLGTQQAVSMPITQDHSSFANYRQAAVTHVDLSKCTHHDCYQTRCAVAIVYCSAYPSLLLADLSVHFDSKSVGGTAKVSPRCSTALWLHVGGCLCL